LVLYVVRSDRIENANGLNLFPAPILLQKITNYEGQNWSHFEKYKTFI